MSCALCCPASPLHRSSPWWSASHRKGPSPVELRNLPVLSFGFHRRGAVNRPSRTRRRQSHPMETIRGSHMKLWRLPPQATCEGEPSPIGKGMGLEPLLPLCCICGLIRVQEPGLPPDHMLWVTQQRYRTTHGVNPMDCPLTHTYCPDCFTKVHDRVRSYSEETAHPTDQNLEERP